MKKTYIIPELNITKLAVENMVAASPEGFNSKLGSQGVSGDVSLVKEQGDQSYNVWDDDWSR